MLISTLGLGIVIARNAAESLSELALLQAVSFGRCSLFSHVLAAYLPPLARISHTAAAIFEKMSSDESI